MEPERNNTTALMTPNNSVGKIETEDDNPHLHNTVAVNSAIEQIGFGKYQWQLFFTCGFGFVIDNMLPGAIGLVLPQITNQWSVKYPPMILTSAFVGSIIGAILGGVSSDFIGRKIVWQSSLLFVSAFAMITAASPNFTVLCIFIGLQFIAAGGNFAIDLTVYIETLPNRKQYMVTALALWWGVGLTLGGFLAWPLITFFSCPQFSAPGTCKNSENMGWRYQYILIGGVSLLAALIRIFAMKMEESPRWLVAAGKFEEAAIVLKKMSRVNSVTLDISPDHFQPLSSADGTNPQLTGGFGPIKGLFASKKLAISTSGIIILWMCIGIAYPVYALYLPVYIQSNGAKLGNGSTFKTYRDYCISATVGMFGPILSASVVTLKFFGSRRSMVIMALCAAAFCAGFTSVRTEGSNIAFSSLVSFWQNALYAIVFSYTPAVMPTGSRGTGCGIAFASGRLASLSAPFIATFGDLTTSVPLWIVVGLYGFIGLVALALPLEPETCT